MDKTRVSIVSYLNSRPFLYGLNKSKISEKMDLSLDIPSKIAAKLAFNQTDLGLIPVAGLEDLEDYKIISRYCIGAVGKVRTVVLASQVPIEFIDTILMDYQSRSSVLLTKILAKFYWRKNFKWKNTCAGFEQKSIGGTTAGILIGDRVFDVEKNYLYKYDLSEEWNKFTRLPFVFAVWAATKDVSKQFETDFNQALEFGLENISEIACMELSNYPEVDIQEYLGRNISYRFDEFKKAGMKKFLELANKLEPVELS